MKKFKVKNAFTLIELLAVIVILAIIALIAVPTVMNIINKAQKSAFKDSAYGIIKAGELYYTNQLLEPAGMATDKTFEFPNSAEGLEISGSKPTGGSMKVTKEGNVSMAVTNGKYCITKGYEDSDVTITEDIENCNMPGTLSALVTTSDTLKITEVDTCSKNKTEGACNPGTAFAIQVNNSETYKFYVLKDTGSEVTLIMDRNLYSETDENNGNVAWYSDGDDTTNDANTQGPLTALAALKQRTSDWTNIPKYTYRLINDSYDPEGKGSTNTYPDVTGELVSDVRARLPRPSEIYAINSSAVLTDSLWIYENLKGTGDDNTDGYWTSASSRIDSSLIYSVDNNGNIVALMLNNITCYDDCVSLLYPNSVRGLRPVITLSK